MGKSIDRRTFVMGSVGAGMAELAGDALSACAPQQEAAPVSQDVPVEPQVFITSDISPGGLMGIWSALGAQLSGNVAVKLSTGEPGSNRLALRSQGDVRLHGWQDLLRERDEPPVGGLRR